MLALHQWNECSADKFPLLQPNDRRGEITQSDDPSLSPPVQEAFDFHIYLPLCVLAVNQLPN